MKTKRFWLVLLAVLSVVCMALAIVGCGENEVEVPVNPGEANTHTHTWGEWEIVTPVEDCSDEPGLQRRYCTDPKCPGIKLNKNYQEEVIPARGHPEGSIKVHEAQEPTCTEAGWYEYTECLKCGWSDYKEKVRPALDHNYIKYEAKEPTCYSEGWDEYEECSRCHDVKGTKNIKKRIEHDYQEQPDGSFICSMCKQPKLEESTNLTYKASADGTYYIVTGYKTNNEGQILDEQGEVYKYQKTEKLLGNSNLMSVDSLALHDGKLCEVSGTGDSATYTEVTYHKMMTLVIPDSHKEGDLELPVKEVDAAAFYGYNFITTLATGSGVETISREAFNHCAGLQTVSFGPSLRTISSGSFSYTGITGVEFPRLFNSLQTLAFNYCPNFSSIKIDPQNQTYYSPEGSNCLLMRQGGDDWQDKVVLGCKNSNIPDEAKSIGNWAFGMCTGLKEINTKNVTKIDPNAFMLCRDLERVTTGDSLTFIANSAFYGCTSLNYLRLGAGLTNIGSAAFANCYKLLRIIYNGTKSDFTAVKFLKGEHWDWNDGRVDENGDLIPDIKDEDLKWEGRTYIIELKGGLLLKASPKGDGQGNQYEDYVEEKDDGGEE